MIVALKRREKMKVRMFRLSWRAFCRSTPNTLLISAHGRNQPRWWMETINTAFLGFGSSQKWFLEAREEERPSKVEKWW